MRAETESNRDPSACGRPGLPIPDKPDDFYGSKATLNSSPALQSCVRVEVAVLGSPSLISLKVYVDGKQR